MWSEVDEKYDIIISNPPYIRNDEEIQDIVRDNEPALALYGGADGLDCYRKIRERLLEHTCNQFLLAMEIGDLQKDAVVSLFSDIPNVQIVTKKDLQGKRPYGIRYAKIEFLFSFCIEIFFHHQYEIGDWMKKIILCIGAFCYLAWQF